jgi:DnaJ-class molecular chaperone
MSDDTTKPGDEVAPGTPQSGQAICPACGGKGSVEGRSCESCRGSGTITALVGDA